MARFNSIFLIVFVLALVFNFPSLEARKLLSKQKTEVPCLNLKDGVVLSAIIPKSHYEMAAAADAECLFALQANTSKNADHRILHSVPSPRGIGH